MRTAAPKPNEAAPASRAADARMITVEAGTFVRGSSEAEREQAYEDYLETSGRNSARDRQWFRFESDVSRPYLAAFSLDAHPVTQAAYAEFVASTKTEAPYISASQWRQQGFVQTYESEVARYNWIDGSPPAGRATHPVVLVPWARAQAYCQWRGQLTGHARRLPTADEFEKAARGPNGSAYPWGPDYDASKLNSAVLGPRDTTPVESFPAGNSAIGASDMAGNVFQWTSTPWPQGTGRMTVKGSAWDDFGGLGRAAASHGRPATVLHAIVGFRCAGPPASARP